MAEGAVILLSTDALLWERFNGIAGPSAENVPGLGTAGFLAEGRLTARGKKAFKRYLPPKAAIPRINGALRRGPLGHLHPA